MYVWLTQSHKKTIFGTNFFAFEPDRAAGQSPFAMSRQFWIYWALSVPLTIVTLGLWLWWNSRAEHLKLARFRANNLRAQRIALAE
jgi:hypothetical protein